jgi:thymidylate synthase|tara:strand:+ start:2593 stop:3555 length:963 start_codon:yes stop_codon:yes gene_type:complete
MKVITAHSVDEAYMLGMNHLNAVGNWAESRNGRTLVAPGPVTTTYVNPRNRVLFNKTRDANPFFHLMESLWMLDGRHDVDWIAHYARQMRKYSDDGKTFHGAYGYRWRHWFGFDQLQKTIDLLQENPDDRRVVLSMWDAKADLGHDGGDFPCNTHVYFRVVAGRVDITVCNRSNDIIWGCYGSNAVHMSYLQEYVAAALNLGVGNYYQMSNNFHAYEDVWNRCWEDNTYHPLCPYDRNEVEPFPLVRHIEVWNADLATFMKHTHEHVLYGEPFFEYVAKPMAQAWDYWRSNNVSKGRECAAEIKASDWRMACEQWLERRV